MVVETTQDARTDVTVMAHVVYLGLVSAFVIGVHPTVLKGCAPSVLR